MEDQPKLKILILKEISKTKNLINIEFFFKTTLKVLSNKGKVQNWSKGIGQFTIPNSTCKRGIEWVVKDQTRQFLLGWPKVERFAKTTEMV